MSKVITFSRVFPSYHPRKGEPTNFVPKIWASLYFDCKMQFDLDMPELENEIKQYETSPMEYKHHTIRSGHRFKAGDWFSPRVWSGKPYNSKQIIIAPDIQVKKVWRITIDTEGLFYVNGELFAYPSSDFALIPLAANDGLEMVDFLNWFNYPRAFDGQIICWNENINY